MKVVTTILFSVSLAVSLFAQVEKPDYIKSEGFFMVDGKVYNADGTRFLMRGVNQNHFWGDESKNLKAMTAIPNSHANIVRVVMSNADWQNQSRTPAKKRQLVEKYIDLGLIPMVELHDGTCEKDPAFIEDITDEWTHPDNVAWLNEYEEYVILNIANEWGPGDTKADWQVWRDTYKASITRIRDAGINNMLIIDSPKCGQGPRAMQVYGQELIDHDPQHNVVLSIHFYGWWRTEDQASDVDAPNQNNPPWLVSWELQTMIDKGLPVIVGEFGWIDHDHVSYDTERILEFCQKKDIGWVAWTWVNKGGGPLDMVKNWQYDSEDDLTEYGDLLINHPLYGMRATSVQATVFGKPNERPTVGLNGVSDGQKFKVGERIELSATASDPDGKVTRMALYSNDRKIAESEGESISFTMSDLARGQYAFYALAEDDSGQYGTSEQIQIKVGFRELKNNALFIVRRTELTEEDEAVKERLNMLGYNVALMDDSELDVTQAAGNDIIAVSSTTSPFRVKSNLNEINIPVLCWLPHLFDDMKMTGRGLDNLGLEDGTEIHISAKEHSMAAGLSGTVPVYREESRLGWGVPSSDADIIAHMPDDSTHAAVFVYEKGDEMIGITAPAARIGFFMHDRSLDQLTNNGWKLFDAAVDYALASTVEVKESQSALPDDVVLCQNHPNPFNPTTRIEYALPEPADVKMTIYNIHGQMVQKLVDEKQSGGSHTVVWNGQDVSGSPVANGLYFYELLATASQNTTRHIRKMMLVR